MSSPRASGAPALLKAQEPVPKLLRDLVHERTGIFFDSDRTELMLEKLEPRAVAHNCKSYLDYYYILKYDDTGNEEWRRVMDAFSVQETYFWREPDQIRTLVNNLVPAWFKRTSLPLRIWSAACATGEEPYTLVMALREAGWGGHPIEIFASDGSESALSKARLGAYRERSFRVLSDELREKYFERRGEIFSIRPEVANRVNFSWANLMTLDEVSAIPPVNIIFCRNVFIYFSPATIKRVLISFSGRVPSQGHLFVGASESLLRLTDQFELQEIGGAFVYVRNSR